MTLVVEVDFDYPNDVIANVYIDDKLFMKSKVRVGIPERPYYSEGCKYSCTKAKYDKWELKVFTKIYDAITKSFNPNLYGELTLYISGLGEQYERG